MLAKIQESYCFFIVVLDAIGIVLSQTRQKLRGLLDILVAMTKLLVDTGTLKNKLYAVLLIACTLPVVFLEGDATVTIFVGVFAVPMFFAKKNWIL